MSFRMIFALVFKDIRMHFKSLFFIALFLTPIMVSLLFSFILPASREKSYIFATTTDASEKTISSLGNFGDVEVFESYEHMNSRVLQEDNAIGIDFTGSTAFIILEGNEPSFFEDYTKLVLTNLLQSNENKSSVTLSDIGESSSSLKFYIGAGIIALSVFIGGLVLGINILKERKVGTLSSVLVSSVSKKSFVFSKSIFAVLFTLAELFSIVLLLRFEVINLFMLISIVLSGSLFSIFLGFFIGLNSKSQITAFYNTLIIFGIVTLSVLFGIFAPVGFHVFVFWSPLYWFFNGVYNILNNSFIWYDVVKHLGISLVINLALIFSLRGKVNRVLDEPE